jgi:hypothetical protein
MQPTFIEALKAHRSVRKPLYYSPEPPVWWNPRKPRLLNGTEDQIAEANVFAAAVDLGRKRFAPELLYLTSRFVAPDPLVPLAQQAYVIDVLCLVRDVRQRATIRQLAVQIGGAINDRRDQELARLGYEVLHVVRDWARIDPQRCIFELFRLAGVVTLSRFERQVAGQTISDYRCAFCASPMIRTATGEGIAFHRDRPIHEQCFNDAVNEGFDDDVC